MLRDVYLAVGSFLGMRMARKVYVGEREIYRSMSMLPCTLEPPKLTQSGRYFNVHEEILPPGIR